MSSRRRLAGLRGWTIWFYLRAIILPIAATISRVIGETFDATLIASLVLLGATIHFVQPYRSRRIIEHLRAKVASATSALRDGT